MRRRFAGGNLSSDFKVKICTKFRVWGLFSSPLEITLHCKPNEMGKGGSEAKRLCLFRRVGIVSFPPLFFRSLLIPPDHRGLRYVLISSARTRPQSPRRPAAQELTARRAQQVSWAGAEQRV